MHLAFINRPSSGSLAVKLPRLISSFLLLLAGPLPALAQSTPDSVTIPLQLVQLASGDYKLGIPVSLGGGPFKLYEFDTGASGFYAANNTAWWPTPTTVNATIVNQMYSSGIFYNSTIVNTTVSLGNGIPTLTANMAQIQAAGGGSLGNWTANVTAGIPPLYGAFFGDFGIGLSTGNGIFGILPQLPGNLSNGFIIRTGGFANPHPTLQIGITAADRAQFTILVPMNGTVANVTFPNSGYPTYAQQIMIANSSFDLGLIHKSFPAGLVLDTGAPSMEIHDNGTNITLPDSLLSGKKLLPGTTVTLTDGDWVLSFIAGSISGLNSAKDVPDPTDGRINTGLITFFTYDVMFDVQNGTIGFYPNALNPQPPYITGQPLGVSVAPGAVANFNAAANANPAPNYQWQLSTNRGRTWSNITAAAYVGATTPSLSFVTTQAMNTYCFRLMAMNSEGTAISNTAVLAIGAPPVIFRHPSGRTIRAGQTMVFSAGVTGKTPLKYQWQFNNVNLSNTGNVRGASSTVLTLSKVTLANAGKYRLVVTNPFGVATSINAALKVQ
jgi:hypothetical protein